PPARARLSPAFPTPVSRADCLVEERWYVQKCPHVRHRTRLPARCSPGRAPEPPAGDLPDVRDTAHRAVFAHSPGEPVPLLAPGARLSRLLCAKERRRAPPGHRAVPVWRPALDVRRVHPAPLRLSLPRPAPLAAADALRPPRRAP